MEDKDTTLKDKKGNKVRSHINEQFRKNTNDEILGTVRKDRRDSKVKVVDT